MKLLLFDIDGTLMHTYRAGMQAAERAFAKLFGIENAMEGIRTDGLTDPLILRMMFEKVFKRDFSMEESESFYFEYVRFLDEELNALQKITVLPGVLDLLGELSGRKDCVLALGTGNIEEGAWIKLRYAGLRTYFDTGGFGSDSENRNELLNIGINKASMTYNSGAGFNEVYVIGDTPHDIVHGRAAGAITVAVATGSYSMEELGEAAPDHLIRNLDNKSLSSKIL